ncbi:ARGI protein, partial [Acromyrmex heyeri]
MNILSKVRIISNKLGIHYYSRKVGIIGVPFDKGQKKEGVARGPETIRAANLVDKLKILDLDVRDYGDVHYNMNNMNDIKNMSHLGHVASCMNNLSEQIRQVLRDGRQVLTIGGDHSLSIGTIDGHVKEKQDVAVIWVDAHADLNTNKTSESGNVHGMPVALLTSELADYWPYLPGMDWQMPIEAIHLMEEISRTHRLNAIDLVEVNPQIGNEQDVKMTVQAAIHIIQAALGYSRRGLKVPEGVTDMPLQTFH